MDYKEVRYVIHVGYWDRYRFVSFSGHCPLLILVEQKISRVFPYVDYR